MIVPEYTKIIAQVNAINMAIADIAGNGKGISRTPLTLVVMKNVVPDLTMANLLI